MPDILEGYRKQKEYLICVDSDGCAMDTMDSKHITCFRSGGFHRGSRRYAGVGMRSIFTP